MEQFWKGVLKQSITTKVIGVSKNYDQSVFTNAGVMLSSNIKIPQQTKSLPLSPLFKVLPLCAKRLNKTIGKNPTPIILPVKSHFEKQEESRA